MDNNIKTFKLPLTGSQVQEKLALIEGDNNSVEIQAKKVSAKAGTVSGDTDLTLTTKNYVDESYTIAGQKEGTTLGTKATAEGNSTTAEGNYSHAEGYYTTASDMSAHAEGYETNATRQATHAEGYKTIASGYYSHAEGNTTKADGNGAHAEGSNTAADGEQAHAEGRDTTASGVASHAEGSGTTAAGWSSHAEGNSASVSAFTANSPNDDILTAWDTAKFAMAKGEASHVEGQDCLALSKWSHAEGHITIASGIYAHAEGYKTKAKNQSAHAEGCETTASGMHSHAEGYYTTASGDHAHAEGSSSSVPKFSEANPSNDSIITAWTNTKFAMAKGKASHVEGQDCLALNSCSHAEGSGTTASGNYSHAEGMDTTASGNYSHAEGYGTTASGSNSHAEGYKTIAKGSQQHVLGKYNIPDSNSYFIIGKGSDEENRSNAMRVDTAGNAEFAGTVKVGADKLQVATKKDIEELNVSSPKTTNTSGLEFISAVSQANGKISATKIKVQEATTGQKGVVKLYDGLDSTSTDTAATANAVRKAYDTACSTHYITTGQRSTKADGTATQTGTKATAEGLNTDASGNYSHAEGNSTTAEGNYSHAEGYYTTAYGTFSHAEGSSTTASGMHSHAEGYGTTASGVASHAEGEETTASADAAHAEGINTIAAGECAHAEGRDTKAEGDYSHAEGRGTIANGSYQHVSGRYNEIDEDDTYAVIVGNGSTYTNPTGSIEETRLNIHTLDWDGNAWFRGNIRIGGERQDNEDAQNVATQKYVDGSYTIAGQKEGTTLGAHATAEGYNTTASGDYSHAEGTQFSFTPIFGDGETLFYYSTASGNGSHAEGCGSLASGDGAHAEGCGSLASGDGAHAEGSCFVFPGENSPRSTSASGEGSHAEGRATVASGTGAHAEGQLTTAKSRGAHAEGVSTTAGVTEGVGVSAHAEGSSTTASGDYSHAEGYSTTASGQGSHAAGWGTVAKNFQYALGHYNNESTEASSATDKKGAAFIIGNGSSVNQRSNAFRVDFNGQVYSCGGVSDGTGAYNGGGADYAELFEWADLNANDEDRRGYFITLDGDKVKIASPGDYILGIVSSGATVLGNNPEDWNGRYIRDEFGCVILEEYTYEETVIDEETSNETTVTKTGKRYKQNPDYNPEQAYVERDKRPEWAAVGMLGVLSVRDDGTCKVNGFCTVAEGGIATASETGYRVIKRVNDHIVKVIFR